MLDPLVRRIVIACINAMIAAALARSDQFCFYSVAAGSIVLSASSCVLRTSPRTDKPALSHTVLPGFIVLCAALELANRSIVSGAVRLTFATLYSLFLGFGLSLGAEIYAKGGNGQITGAADYTCAYLREGAPWWRQTIPRWFYFLTIPCFLLCMALKNGQPLFRRDTLVMVVIGCAGAPARLLFVGRDDVADPLVHSRQASRPTSSQAGSSRICLHSRPLSDRSRSASSATRGAGSRGRAQCSSVLSGAPLSRFFCVQP